MADLRDGLEKLIAEHGLDAVIEELDEIEKEELGLDDDDSDEDSGEDSGEETPEEEEDEWLR